MAGVYYDYASDQGLVMISRRDLSAVLARPRGSRASPSTSRPVPIRTGRSSACGRCPAARALSIQSNRALKKISLEIFDRTFRITGVLRMLAGLVAFIGVLSSLMALQLERTRELGVLRANGLTPGQVWQLVTSQTGLMGLAAGLLSIPVGLALAAIMIFVINRRSFGWTIHMEVAPGDPPPGPPPGPRRRAPRRALPRLEDGADVAGAGVAGGVNNTQPNQ